MTPPLITGLYAGLLGVIFIVLTLRVGALRARLGIPIHDGGDKRLGLEIRRHGNFTEHVPLALLLMALLESTAVLPAAIHVMGALLVAGRILHPMGLNRDTINSTLRAVGAGSSLLVITVASLWLIYKFVTG